MKLKKRIFICLMAVLILLVFAFSAVADNTVAVAQPETSDSQSDGFEKISENENLSLWLNRETNNFFVEDRATAKRWYAFPQDADNDALANAAYIMQIKSLLQITVWDVERETEDVRNSYAVCVMQSKAKIQTDANGFTVEYDFASSAVKVTLSVQLCDNGIKVSLPADKITESNPEKYRLLSVAVLPYMQSGKTGDSGAIILPDGCGEVLDFSTERSSAANYEKKIYGKDKTLNVLKKEKTGYNITCPYLAEINGDTGILSYPSGAAAIGYVAASPAGKNSSYANAYYKFEYRASDYAIIESSSGKTTGTRKFSFSDIGDTAVVDYVFLFNSPDWSSLAAAYGDYLSAGTENDTVSENSIFFEIYGYVNSKAFFLGIPYTKTEILSSGEDIVAFANDTVFDGASVRLCNVTSADGSGKICNSAEPIGKVLTKSQLKQLSSTDKTFYINVDPITFTKNSLKTNSFFSASKTVYGSVARVKSFLESTLLVDKSVSQYYMLKPSLLEKNMNKIISSLKKYDGFGLSSDTLAVLSYNDYSVENSTLADSAECFENACALLAKNTSLVLSNPADYAYKYCSAVTDIPISSSNDALCNGSFPFLQMALSGNFDYSVEPINLYRSPDDMFLMALLTGSKLNYAFALTDAEELIGTDSDYLYSVDYSLFKDKAAEQYSGWKAAAAHTAGSAIATYTNDGSTATAVFENGKAITVDFESKTYELQ